MKISWMLVILQYVLYTISMLYLLKKFLNYEMEIPEC